MRLTHVRVAGVDQAAGLLVRKVRVVAKDARDIGHVPAALAHRLAGVEGLLEGHRLLITIDQAGDRIEQRGALAGRRP